MRGFFRQPVMVGMCVAYAVFLMGASAVGSLMYHALMYGTAGVSWPVVLLTGIISFIYMARHVMSHEHLVLKPEPEISNLSTFITDRLQHIKMRRPMWGSMEAVELQALTLIEVEHYLRLQVTDPERKQVREALNEYQRQVRLEFPNAGLVPVCDMGLSDDDFSNHLDVIVQRTRMSLLVK